jgi:uncharacterized protein YjiS (DUF1127 family)
METNMFRADQYPAFSLPLTMTGLRAHRSRSTFVRHAVDTVGAALRQIARAISGQIKMRRAIHALSALDDRMLEDIGIVRDEIPYRVRAARRAARRVY